MLQRLLGLLDWIYKKRCYFCKRSKESVRMCSDCFDKLIALPICVNRIINGVNVYCAGNYSKELQKLIRGLKYHKQRDLAHYQAKFMYEYWQKLNYTEDFQVVPVPLHTNRKKKRHYNHMELVAKEFCYLTGYEYNFDLITRIKDTKLLGVPFVTVFGNTLQEGFVEIEETKTGEKKKVALADYVKAVLSLTK